MPPVSHLLAASIPRDSKINRIPRDSKINKVTSCCVRPSPTIKYACILDSGSSHLQHGLWTLTHLLYTVQHKLTLRVADNLTVRTLTPLPQAGLFQACLQSHLFRRNARDQRSNPPLECLLMVNSVIWAFENIRPASLCFFSRCGGVVRVVRDVLQCRTLPRRCNIDEFERPAHRF